MLGLLSKDFSKVKDGSSLFTVLELMWLKLVMLTVQPTYSGYVVDSHVQLITS